MELELLDQYIAVMSSTYTSLLDSVLVKRGPFNYFGFESIINFGHKLEC